LYLVVPIVSELDLMSNRIFIAPNVEWMRGFAASAIIKANRRQILKIPCL